MKALLIATAVAFASFGGVAGAAQPLSAVALDQVTAAGGGTVNVDFNKNVNINERLNIHKHIRAKSDVRGNIATADSDAQAYGKNTLTQTLTLAEVDENYYSGSFSQAVASTNNGYRGRNGNGYR